MITKDFIRRTLSNALPGAHRPRTVSLYSIKRAVKKGDPNHDLFLENMRRRNHGERISWINFLLDHKREIFK